MGLAATGPRSAPFTCMDIKVQYGIQVVPGTADAVCWKVFCKRVHRDGHGLPPQTGSLEWVGCARTSTHGAPLPAVGRQSCVPLLSQNEPASHGLPCVQTSVQTVSQ